MIRKWSRLKFFDILFQVIIHCNEVCIFTFENTTPNHSHSLIFLFFLIRMVGGGVRTVVELCGSQYNIINKKKKEIIALTAK
jgi:hypothetical protein